MYETESNPVQPVSLGRGLALVGYWSAGATWLMALVVLLLLVGAFLWMGKYMRRSMQTQPKPVGAQAAPVTSLE
jgi:membrane protein implicated in regulation of membrane protease activity